MQPTGFTSFNQRSTESTVSYESSGEQRSTVVVRKVLENSHRVSRKDLESYVQTMILLNAYTPFMRRLKTSSSKSESEIGNEQPKSDRRLEQIRDASATAFKLPIQNEKKCLSEPPAIIYKIEPDLYSTEFGTYLLQLAGYDETGLTKECGKYISKGEYATFNVETTCPSYPLLSVLMVKRSSGYSVAYFRESTICNAFCLAKGMHSSQMRDRAQTHSIAFFGLTKYEDLESNQKPLVLSFDNPDCTSICFMKFDEKGIASKEYVQDEVALSHKIDTLIKTQGTYMHFMHADLNLICPLNRISQQEFDTTSLSIPERARLQRLL